MTLSSQASRSMMGRVYTRRPRRRRRGFGWKLPVLGLVASGLLVYVMFFREAATPATPANPGAVAATHQSQGPGNASIAASTVAPAIHRGRTDRGAPVGPMIRQASGSSHLSGTSGTLMVGANIGRSLTSATNTHSRLGAMNQGRAIQSGARANQNTGPTAARTPRGSRTQVVATSYVPAKASRVQKRTAPQVVERITQGQNLLSQGKHIEGRKLLSQILTGAGQSLSPFDADQIRKVLMGINNELVFSPRIHPGDPLVGSYKVQPGDYYSRIAPRYKVEWKLLERINQMPANRLAIGRTIKVINGPFHAVIDKSDYRMDMFLPDTDGAWIYITSFSVGLGENNSTPEGQWIIKPRSKTVDPQWSNPRTGQFFSRDNPLNPIGEYWLGLQGTDDNTRVAKSYGIHGTIDPDSIGKQKSMGCIRLGNKQIEFIFQMLVEKHSQIVTKP